MIQPTKMSAFEKLEWSSGVPKHPDSKRNNKKSNQKYIPSFKSKCSLLSNITKTRSPATNKRVHIYKC